MKISELITELEKLKVKHGDVPVETPTIYGRCENGGDKEITPCDLIEKNKNCISDEVVSILIQI